jgi:hypothetical protein
MDPATVDKLLGEVAEALPADSPARRHVEALGREFKMLEIDLTTLTLENARLRHSLDDLTRRHAETRNACAEAADEEVEATGYVWRTEDGRRVGPYCPVHRHERLVQIDDRYMGMYCGQCGAVVPDLTV